MYDNGQGVPQNDQGDTNAQGNLGVLFAAGKGVPQSYGDALVWYRKAAGRGNGEAENNLGILYAKGQGVPQDYVQAHMWFNLSAAQGVSEGAKNRDRVAAKMTSSQIEKAQALAAAWKPTTGQ
jgi:TPR repeat protein